MGEGDDDGFVDGLGVRGGSIGDLGESGAVGFEGAADADEAGGDGLGVGPDRRRMPMPPRPGGVATAAMVSVPRSVPGVEFISIRILNAERG